MRDALAPRVGERRRYRAVFGCYRQRPVYDYRHQQQWSALAAMVTDVRDAQGGQRVADHVWLWSVAGLQRLGHLECGQPISFTAVAWPYIKGYHGRDYERRAAAPPTRDYKLLLLRDVCKVTQGARP